MAYELRERKNNSLIAYYISSDDEGHSGGNNTSCDPDYSRRSGKSRRRARARNLAQGDETPRQRRKLLSASSSANPQCSTASRQQETRDKTVVSWLVSKGQIRAGETVKCQVNRVAKEGVIRGGGNIACKCCSMTMTVYEFEIHAGSLSLRPFENIVVTRTNSSLLQHFTREWDKGWEQGKRQFNCVEPKDGAGDNSDDVCQLCADGGDLMCCDQCPSTFHLGCVEMEALPEEGWYCCYCKCKNCGVPCDNRNKLSCVQCAKAFHLQCHATNGSLDLNDDDMGLFCSSTCKEVAKKIQGMIGVKNMIREGFTWSLIRRSEEIDIEDDHKRMEYNSKVALAFEILNESFMTNVDNYTGINILDSVVNNRGSNLERVNFSSFYTLILERNEAIISAATLRIHDNEMAEMPYIATQNKYRRKGMLRMILDAVTYVLSCIGVKNLVIPAIEEVADMWKGKYGFVPVDSEMKRKLINYNTLMFPGTIRLQKTIAGTSSAMELDHHAARFAMLDLNIGL